MLRIITRSFDIGGEVLRRVAVGLAIMSLLLVSSGTAHAEALEFVYQQVPPPALISSHTFVSYGTYVSGGCRFVYPKLGRPAGVAVWEVRDIGIDVKHCAKLVEEGIPTYAAPMPGGLAVSVVGTNLATPTPKDPLSSGFSQNWYQDGVGKTLTSDQTNLTWQWDGSCATGGATSGQWQWFADSGWVLDTTGGTNTTTCLRQIGRTSSGFHNSSFCWPATTYITYSYVDFYGYFDGTWDGARYSYYSGACLPIYEYFRLSGPA